MVPCEVASLGTIMAPGRPGHSIPIGLYKREIGPEGDSYTRMGDYEFVASFDESNSMSFIPMLKAEEDKTISMDIRDLVSGDTLHLKRLSILSGKKIPKPLSIGVAPHPKQPPTKPGFPSSVTPRPVIPSGEMKISIDIVERMKNKARSAIMMAQHGKTKRPKLKREFEEKIQALERAVQSIPSGNSPDDRTYQQLANRCTELIALLETEGLISDEDKKF